MSGLTDYLSLMNSSPKVSIWPWCQDQGAGHSSPFVLTRRYQLTNGIRCKPRVWVERSDPRPIVRALYELLDSLVECTGRPDILRQNMGVCTFKLSVLNSAFNASREFGGVVRMVAHNDDRNGLDTRASLHPNAC